MDSQPQVIEKDSILSAAQRYRRRGWSVIPIPYRSKNPERSGWDQLRLAESDMARYFMRGRSNIGVLLGEPSGWLVDVDLDHELAVKLAEEHLPSTGAVFGRAGKPRSHWLYRVSEPAATQQWRLPNRKMVVELRSTGGQTVFPGSVHPDGEAIEWDSDGEPATVEPDVLQSCLQKIYDAVCREHGLPGNQVARTELVHSVAAPARVVDRARRYLSKIPPAVSGQGGHDQTFRAACVLVIGFGLGREQALALLGEWNDGCQPQWTNRELEHKVDDALKQPGWRGALLTETDRRVVRPSIRAVERANRHAIDHRRRARRRAMA